MATYKNTSGDYTITGATANAVFTINYANTVFNGNVIYTVPSVSVAPFITVAANNTGAIYAMGLLAQTGPSTWAGLQFNVNANNWQTSNSVYANGNPINSYANIFTGSIGGSNTQIQFNNDNQFDANANFTYDYANSSLGLNGVQYFGYQSMPSNVTNTVAIYSNTTGSGGTGLYFTSDTASDELVSKSKAIVYGIIF